MVFGRRPVLFFRFARVGAAVTALVVSGCASAPDPREAGASALRVRAGADYACARPSRPGDPHPFVARVLPAEGARFGRTKLVLEGGGLAGAVEVRVGEAVCDGLSVEDDRRVSCTLTPVKAMVRPDHAHTSWDVRVTVPGGRCGVLYQAFTLRSNVEIEPRTIALGPGNRSRFAGRRGLEPFRFSVVSGPGVIDPKSGEFRAVGAEASVVVRVTDRLGTSDEALVRISAPLRLHADRNEIAADEGAWLSATGGIPPYVYAIESGAGRVDARTGSYRAQEPAGDARLAVSDAVGNRASLRLVVRSGLTLVADPATLSPGQTAELRVAGGIPPYAFSAQPGRGAIASGAEGPALFTAPSEAGPALVRVRDSRGTEREAAIEVVPTLLAHAPSPALNVGDAMTLRVTGGVPPYRYELARGAGRVDAGTGTYYAPRRTGSELVRVTDRIGNSMSVPVEVTEAGLVSRKLAAGYAHGCGVFGESARCWGDNAYGQLGDASTARRPRPAVVRGLERNVLAVSAGFYHSCALLAGGAVQCWGDNRYGQLGNGTTQASSTPVAVAGLASGVKALSAGQFHTCAVKNENVLCWGDNRRGQLGDGTREPSALPVRVEGLEGAVEFAGAGSWHSCAATRERAWCWGFNRAGQLGNGEHRETTRPVSVRNLPAPILALDAKGSHSCAVTEADGANRLWCWGFNGPGQLGDRTTEFRYVPRRVANLERAVESISLGYTHTCAVEQGGRGLRCWGHNVSGQLGDESDVQYRPEPVPVHGVPTGVQSVAPGVDHTCALLADSVWCWGLNRQGAFGDGGLQSSRSPRRAFRLSDAP